MLDELRPYPKSFGTGIDGWSYLKSMILIEQNPVKYVAFASSIFSDNSDDGDMFFLISFVEPIDSILIDYYF